MNQPCGPPGGWSTSAATSRRGASSAASSRCRPVRGPGQPGGAPVHAGVHLPEPVPLQLRARDGRPPRARGRPPSAGARGLGGPAGRAPPGGAGREGGLPARGAQRGHEPGPDRRRRHHRPPALARGAALGGRQQLHARAHRHARDGGGAGPRLGAPLGSPSRRMRSSRDARLGRRGRGLAGRRDGAAPRGAPAASPRRGAGLSEGRAVGDLGRPGRGHRGPLGRGPPGQPRGGGDVSGAGRALPAGGRFRPRGAAPPEHAHGAGPAGGAARGGGARAGRGLPPERNAGRGGPDLPAAGPRRCGRRRGAPGRAGRAGRSRRRRRDPARAGGRTGRRSRPGPPARGTGARVPPAAIRTARAPWPTRRWPRIPGAPTPGWRWRRERRRPASRARRWRPRGEGSRPIPGPRSMPGRRWARCRTAAAWCGSWRRCWSTGARRRRCTCCTRAP